MKKRSKQAIINELTNIRIRLTEIYTKELPKNLQNKLFADWNLKQDIKKLE